MSYTLRLYCGCVVYVACHPKTKMAHTRVIQQRSDRCLHRKHDVGAHLYLWEILPDERHEPQPEWADHGE